MQHPRDINSNIHQIKHPAAAYLHRLARTGVPAPSMAAPWTQKQLLTIYRRGAHSSALHQFKDFLFEDMLDMIKKKYWVVLPFHTVRYLPGLKLAPVGVVPQRTRRPRPIMDYTFTGVNQMSAPLAPMPALQFGSTVQRLWQRIAFANPAFGPVRMSKIDLSDGYYRIPLSPSAALQLAVVLPSLDNKQALIGIPLVLPMGWKYSPPFFCAFTETATDLANQGIMMAQHYLPHPLEKSISNIAVPLDGSQPSAQHPHHAYTADTPLAYADVYMDDFIGLSQAGTETQTQRAMLHSIDSIFRASTLPEDAPNRKQIISLSKLSTGDCTWSTNKVILGWQLDSADMTLRLPQHKAERLIALLQTFLPLKRTSRRKWQRLLGELRHLAVAIPGARYLFTILQHALLASPTSTRLRLHPLVTSSLQDWQLLAQSLSTTPTPITTLVPQQPSFLGAVDASGTGIGGAWVPTPTTASCRPIIFRLPFPPHIQQRLVSASNPNGTLTNSDLELAALVTGAAILRSLYPSGHAHLLCASDNAAAVTWLNKGSPSSSAARAFLLRWLAKLSRNKSFDISPVFASGATNTLADVCSRHFHLSEQAFYDLIEHRFPIPGGWTLAHPTNEINLNMISALSEEMLPWESHNLDPTQPTILGSCGKTSVAPLPWTPQEPTSQTLYQFYRSLPIATGPARYLPASLRCAAAQWATPYVPLARRWPTWDSTTHAYFHPANWISA